MYIYVLTNTINGKKYVGQTTQTVEKRFKRHCWTSTLKKATMPISMAIRKYGKENFTIETLAKCTTQEELDKLEIHFVQTLETFSPKGYNLRAGQGRGIVNEETRQKISKANLGRKASAETRKKLSESHKGYKVKDETKRKLSEINRGKRGSNLCYERSVQATAKTFYLINPEGEELVITNMAKFCRENNLDKFSMCEVVKHRQGNHKGWKISPNDPNSDRKYSHTKEVKEKLSTINKGKKISEETKKKQSEYWAGKKLNLSKEDRQKRSDALKNAYKEGRRKPSGGRKKKPK